ncbi:MAG: hypothetical protein Hyperionvirus1_89 [Hyperionvirus sp.]|uniref:Uncharacterized protein n=1 Tax=Hyperionvirus sp. TaxID=2487770 RepID=A0A3G5A5I4_9VIRU|nr:MAG: hypothetical protein Hyperionvirus1_89 [Hyperionvirus sp.]
MLRSVAAFNRLGKGLGAKLGQAAKRPICSVPQFPVARRTFSTAGAKEPMAHFLDDTEEKRLREITPFLRGVMADAFNSTLTIKKGEPTDAYYRDEFTLELDFLTLANRTFIDLDGKIDVESFIKSYVPNKNKSFEVSLNRDKESGLDIIKGNVKYCLGDKRLRAQ